MKTIFGLALYGEHISVDNKTFIDCTFTNCTIEYGGDPVILERTAMRGCKYLFSGRAKMTLEFLDCVGLLPAPVSNDTSGQPSSMN